MSKDPILAEFWNSLSTLKPDKDNIINFTVRPDDFPDLAEVLYIRQSYMDLFNIILDHLNKRKNFGGMAITGTPGIGKSVFLFYIMWRLSQMESTKAVILHRQKDNGQIFVFQKNNFWVACDKRDILHLLRNSSTWYLTDSLNPPSGEVKAVTILVASPSRDLYKDFLKYSRTVSIPYYLPVWSLEELNIVSKWYKRSKKDVEERYCLIGGIPRFVLEMDDVENLRILIQDSVGRLDIEKFMQIAGGTIEKEDKISHSIVHFEVDTTTEKKYLEKKLCMASKYITDMALERFVNHQYEELKNFLATASRLDSVSSCRGNLFESFAHRLLAAGGEFAVRSLNGEKVTKKLIIPQLTIDKFFDISKC